MRRGNHYLDLWDRGEWQLPVVPVADVLNPFLENGVFLYAALGFALPYESMKSLAVLGMLLDAKEKWLIEPGKTMLVEATSGATGLSLAHFALSECFGARGVTLVINDDVPHGKRAAPKFAGARIIPPMQGLSAIGTARKLGAEEGYLNLDQYANPANAELYRSWAAPRILEQVPHLSALVVPIGTGGTVIGLSDWFRECLPDITAIGAMCAPGVEIPGMRDLKGMAEIQLPWEAAMQGRMEVEREPSYLAAAWFQWAQSLMVGLSSGATYIASCLFLKHYKDTGTLDGLRGKDGKVHVAMVFHDGARPYLVDRFPMLHLDHQDPSTAPLPWQLLW